MNGLRTVAFWLQIAAVVLAPIAIGGVHTPTAVACLGLAALALLVQLVWRWRRNAGFSPSAMGALLLTICVVVAVQLLPLPRSLLGALSPVADQIRDGAETISGVEGETAVPLTLSPAGTSRELLRLLAAVVTFLGVFGLARTRKDTAKGVLTAITWTGVALLGVAVVQEILGTVQLLGFYQPHGRSAHVFFSSTFVNQGHFGAFLCLAAPLALGLSLDPTVDRHHALTFLVASVALAAGAVLTLSRTVFLVVPFEIAVFAVVNFWGRSRSEHQHERAQRLGSGAFALALFAFVAVLVFVGFSLMGQEWQTTLRQENLSDDSKFLVLPDTLRLIASFPWTGAGYGAFAEVFPGFNTSAPWRTFHYVENGTLQALADLGIPLGSAALLAIVVLVVVYVGRARGLPLVAACAAGLAGLLLENQADFSLSMPGVALPAAAVLAVLVAKARPRRPRQRSEDVDGGSVKRSAGPWSTRVAVAVLLVVTAGAAPLAWLALQHDVDRDRDRIKEEGPAALAAAVTFHPAEPSIAIAGGRAYEQTGDAARARAWFRRALALAPSGYWPALHVLRAALADDDIEEAGAALAVIHKYHWKHRDRRSPALALLKGRPDLAALLGRTVLWEPDEILTVVHDLFGLDAGDLAERLLREAIAATAVGDESAPPAPLLYALGRLHLTSGEPAAADRVATRLLASFPDRAEAFLLQGDVALSARDYDIANHMYLEASRLAPDDSQPLFQRAEALLRMKEWDTLDSVFRELRGRVKSRRGRAKLLSLRSRQAETRGELEHASRLARAATRELPDQVSYLRQHARIFEKMDRPEPALRLNQRILELRPSDATARRSVMRLKSRLWRERSP